MNYKLFSRLFVLVLIAGFFWYFFSDNSNKNSNYAKIQSISGEVSKIDEFTSKTSKLNIGDIVIPNEIIQTSAKSSVLIVLGNGYDLKIRLGENSSLKIGDLMKNTTDHKENSIFSLIRGQLLTSLNNKNKKAQVQIRTRHMAMGIRGTLFSVISDGINGTFLGVKNGEVMATNLLTNKENLVVSNSTFTAMENGTESNQDSKSVMNKINWNVDQDNNTGYEYKGMFDSTSNNIIINNKTKLEDLIANAEKHILEYENELNKYLAKISELSNVVATRKKEADEDIECLSKYTIRCKLNTQKEILLRGFPIEYGNKKYTNLIIAELHKYKSEPLKEIDELKHSNEDLRKTLDYKKGIIANAKNVLSNSNASEEAKLEVEEKLKNEI